MARFLELPDHRLEYVWHGPGPAEAPTLVFLHEGLGSVSTWRDFPMRLADAAGCGALVYSRRGYGGSDRAVRPRGVGFMHDEAIVTLPLVLDLFGISEPILVGESDGASIALIAASQSVPRARGLLLEAPHVFVEDVCLSTISAAERAFERGDLRGALARHHATDVEDTFRSWSAIWLDPAFRSFDIVGDLARVSAPVLAIQGEDDPYGTLRQVERVAAGCGGFVQVRVMRDCGHSPHRERPDATLEAMGSFLRAEIGIGAGAPARR